MEVSYSQRMTTSSGDLKSSDHSSGEREQAYHGLSFIVPRGKGINPGLFLNPPLWGHLSKLAQKHLGHLSL